MELRELRLIISRHFVIVGVVFAMCVSIGLAAAYLPAKTYRTSTSIILDIPASAEGTGSIQQISFLIPALQEWAQSRSLRIHAETRVPEDLRVPKARIEAVADASVMRIKATAHSPQAAQAWANAVGEQLIEERGDNGIVELVQLDPAPLKKEPIAPRSGPIMVAAVVLGFILSLFAALAAERIKQSFDTNRAVRERLGTTVLGELPVMRRSEAKLPIIRLLYGAQASSEMVVAFETLRTNVEFLMHRIDVRRLAVVSLSGEIGKSTVAAGLSCSMAQVGRPVIALDADLHHPTLAEHLGARPSFGLGDVAAWGATDVPLQATRIESLQMLPAGIPTGRPADVIATTLPKVLEILEEERSDATIIIDGPPLRGAPESSIIMAQAHHVILVANSRGNDFSALSDSIDRISESGATLLGIVLNRKSRHRVRKDSYEKIKRPKMSFLRSPYDDADRERALTPTATDE